MRSFGIKILRQKIYHFKQDPIFTHMMYITHLMNNSLPEMIFGVCISTKPCNVRYSLKRRHTAASTRNIA